MNSTPMSTIVLAVLLVSVAVAAIVWASIHRKRQSLRLKRRFGSEYDRTVQQLGSQSRAEAELQKRESRVAKLKIRALAADEAARFHQAWCHVQGRFVDNPKGAVAEADKLVRELMTARGYPMGEFERRASDISVDHPAVVEAYRAAQIIAVRDARGEADTEELRKAMVHYRTLFSDLLEVHTAPATEGPKHSMAVRS
jgi:hypothetical protein